VCGLLFANVLLIRRISARSWCGEAQRLCLRKPLEVSEKADAGMDATFRLEFTPEQVDGYLWLTGTRREDITLSRRKLGALVLAAAAAGRDLLPISESPDMIHCMLHPESLPDDISKPFVVCLSLTAEQSEQIRLLTRQHMRTVAIAPDESAVDYGETWDLREPIRISRTITIAPAEVSAPASNGNHVVKFPKSASGVFGTGRHPATSTAMRLIEDHLPVGARVFDIGTGSGILAIAAARLGAAEILAVDVEANAVVTAREAVAFNGLSQQIKVELGSIEIGQTKYDMVVMNIFPPVILALAPNLPRVLKPGGLVVTSGTTTARSHDLVKGMARYGYQQVDERVERNWVAHLFREGV
jgi:ribosomal protein L11 methylase PrmA